ncbi:MAG TPA: hypothetical protein VK550_24870 [Polyangiaceae bacterium]|nr:hypothetical protein [Polyangiaceae bacterium]
MQKRSRDSGETRPPLAICLIALGLSACHAQVKAGARVNASEAQVEDDRKWEIAEPASPPDDVRPAAAPQPASRVASAMAPAQAPASSGLHFVGVVHDLSLSSSAPRAAACRCLAVVYGPPSDAKFSWQVGPPAADHDTIAIAIATDGVACPSGAPPLHASIAGIEREGTDIVVVVENVSEGRPIMRGALAAWPGPNGAIVVRTRRDSAYPAASGSQPCRIALK